MGREESRHLRVLVTGATGLVGSAVCARLAADGHTVTASARRIPPVMNGPAVSWVAIDFSEAEHPSEWTPHLQRVDVVVNCVGVLQDSAREDTAAAHARGAAALFRACAVDFR